MLYVMHYSVIPMISSDINRIDFMQQNNKELFFKETLGTLLNELRLSNTNLSSHKFANAYDLNDSNLGKIERAIIDCKFITLWKILEGLNIDPVEFVSLFIEKLGKNFKLILKMIIVGIYRQVA